MTAQETVVLVHGLWMHGSAMALMRGRIARCGYRVVSYSYPSMRLTLGENAERLARFCRDLDAPRLHLVGHSLGGLLALRALEGSIVLRVGRIVLLGSPCGESHAARRLSHLPGGRWLLGNSIREWRAGASASCASRYEIGVIAGSLGVGLGRIIAPDLPVPNDGVVTVEETRLDGMRDSVVLRVNHLGMILSAAVARQVCAFLRDGRFLGLEMERRDP